MGIRHLISFLRPFVESESLNGRSVVIDGSAFAHHLYHVCLGRRSKATNAFEAVPTYSELAQAAIEWLDLLKDNGVLVKNIYFDGFLPPAKFNTRLERLVDLTSRLLKYYKSSPRPCKASIPPSKDPEWLFRSRAIPAKLMCIPPLSFVVPAVIEALLRSEYADITAVVPDEADLYCAKYAKQFGCVVLTGDSDLLIYDIGPKGAVCFLNDIELMSENNPNEIRGLIYHPATIASRLGLVEEYGLRSLAFEIDMEPDGSFGKLHAQSKGLEAIKAYPDRYKDFLEQYSELSDDIDKSTKASRAIFSTLDPRVSEYVLQFPSLANAAGKNAMIKNTKPQQPFHVFLPCLVECPRRTTSWEASSATRQLAYGLINIVVSDDEKNLVIVEHRRQEATSGGRRLQLPTKIEAIDACSSLHKMYLDLQAKLPHLSDTQLWTAVVIAQELEWSSSQDRPTLSDLAVNYFNTVRDDDKSKIIYDWDLIQFFSQVQASLYSLRILHQITSVVLSYEKVIPIPNSLLALFEQLQHLPKLCQYQDRGNFDFLLAELPSIITASKVVLNIERAGSAGNEILDEERVNIVSEKRNKSEKRVKQRRDQNVTLASKRQKPNNPFDLLDLE